MRSLITVLKIGGSVLKNENDLPKAVHEIYRHWRRGEQVLAVTSAFGGTTESLLSRASAYNETDPNAIAHLLSTGEATSASLLTLALKQAGIPVRLLNALQAGIRTTGASLDAEPLSANTGLIKRELKNAVVVIPGFVGLNSENDLTLLGRGGTDLSAIFLAKDLDARCVLIKDVDGLYESDPNVGSTPRRFVTASYDSVIRFGNDLVQSKAVRFAAAQNQCFEITSLGSYRRTLIGKLTDKFDTSARFERPLRVALLGCGTVGGGVYQRLSELPELFEITGVVNLDPEKALAGGVRFDRLRRDAHRLIANECDAVIELIGGINPARQYIEFALDHGRYVVTANKALVATAGNELSSLAHRNGVSLKHSASVGGALPALETISRVGGTARAIQGIINGTCNFIVDQLAGGVEMNEAIKLAQEHGFAEADPTLDLDGTDAAQKLVLLARDGFGIDLSLADVEREGIGQLTSAKVLDTKSRGKLYRLVAECRRTSHGFRASVKPVEISLSHPFAQVKGAENCLLIESDLGESKFIKARGAGRHATTESVIADLFDVREEFFSHEYTRVKEAAA
jgi:homoserine dehydrogenase